MSERHLPDDQSSTIDPYLITSVRQTLAEQGAALQNLSKQLDSGQYQRVLNLIMNCKGHVILSGMGKSGHVGRKMSATLASTGTRTPSFFIHPAEAFHGDLGMITPYDLLILISASGETDEILKLVPSLKNFGNRIIAITNNGNSPLAGICDYKIVTATREKLLTEEFWFSRVTATAVMEILYLLLRAGMKGAMEHIRRHEKAISPDKK